MSVLISKLLLPSQLYPLLEAGIDYHLVQTNEIQPIPLFLTALSGYGVISSSNALISLEPYIHHLPEEMFIVGHKTAGMLKYMGCQSELHVFNSMSELVKDLVKKNPDEVHYFCGSIHRSELEMGLAKLNSYTLKWHYCYNTTKLFPVVHIQNLEAIMAFSPLSLENLTALNQFDFDIPIFCIGKSTAKKAAELGFLHIHISKSPVAEALVQLLIEYIHDTKRFISSNPQG